MKNHLLILSFLCFGSVFSQSLEDRIYDATDDFNNIKSTEALITLDQQVSVFEKELTTTDDFLAFVNLLINKAHYLKTVNKKSQAIKSYERAWQIYSNRKIASVYKFNIVDYCLIPLGVLYNQVGDHTSAENIIKTYIAIAEKNNNNSQRVSGAVNLSRLYQTIGRHQLAIDIANYGLTIKQANKLQKNNLKRIKTRSQIRLKQPVTIIDKVIVGNNKPQSIEDYELAYEIAIQKEDYETALKKFKTLKSLKTNTLSSASLLAKIQIEEAQLYYKLKQIDNAKKSLKTALQILIPDYDSNKLPNETQLYSDNAFIGVFDMLAVLETNPKKAILYYNLSFYVNDLLAKNVTSQEGKLLLLNEKRNRSEKSIELLYGLQNTTNSSNYTLEALQISERYKSSILKDMVDKKKLLESYPNDSLLIQQQILLNKQEQLTTKLIRAPYSNFNKEEKLKIRADLTSINIELKNLKVDIEKKYKTSENNSLEIAKLNSKLIEDNSTLVNYFYGKKAIYQIIVSEKATAFNKIILSKSCTKKIKKFIEYFNSPSVINNDVSKYTEDAFNLYNLLKLNEVKNKENLIIIPDGFLNFIPFDALLSSKTTEKNFANMPFFVKTHTVAFNSSTLLYINEGSSKVKYNVLGVFPVFKNSNSELYYSIDEAKSLDKEMKTTILMNNEATKTSFLNQAKNHTVLHLSTHGTSGDFFNPAQIAFSDQPLSINELYSLDLNPELVVLSACETGVGELKSGEGSQSIARGFQYAGAKKVLYSLWQISDLSTSQIMASFYKRLDHSKSISYSNKQSKLDYLKNKDIKNIKKSPYYWSAFTLYGGFDKVEKTNYTWQILGFLLVIMLLLLWLFKRKNGKRTLGISAKKRI